MASSDLDTYMDVMHGVLLVQKLSEHSAIYNRYDRTILENGVK